ncbi:MAG: hypothetical protein GVY13_19460 [Alphaproteobacteria bacterium]|jgi:tRNA 2-thiouridine synthesizing protein A|nr:hypothetical protein [Alphaproteobacteria bacterium]
MTVTLPPPARTIDARDLQCPLPVLKARKALNLMAGGEILEVRANDPAAPLDFQVFCHHGGHRLVSMEEAEGVTTFVIEKDGAAGAAAVTGNR